MAHLDRIRVAGFKSIRDQELELKRLNVLIGANGAGKSNLIAVFQLLHQIANERLQLFVGTSGGADRMLHFGRKVTEEMRLQFTFGSNAYHCVLVPTTEDALVFGEETEFFYGRGYSDPYDSFLGSGHKETLLYEEPRRTKRKSIGYYVLAAFKSWRINHFHDTGDTAKIKLTGDLDDNRFLRHDAGNLAAFLYLLQETKRDCYHNIVDVVKMVAPFFGGFNLQPDRLNPKKIKLEWHESGSDSYFDAQALSDGTLRFICMVTLLLQPELPSTILLDEPELGLHPYAISVLADLLRSASERTQIIVSTQSVTLVNQLSPEDVIVVDRVKGESIFRRPSSEEISSWLDDYALGDLWEKNVLGGRPGH
ncbi:MAG TPA: AAA family ATPase [Thermoanaerobaculia bacterium]|jgi:predicted ATPase